MLRSPAITSLLSGQAAKPGLGSTRVTSRRESARFRKRAAVAPAKPPPITTTRGAAPWASRGRGNAEAAALAAADARKWRRAADAFMLQTGFPSGCLKGLYLNARRRRACPGDPES